ncbi:kinase-like domain-containing protein [Cristinia sonorae]|uniref:Kinase-like domain-containing protein n=1 Tax=Cristinia sonorae TaxID=1940300 RepID=A0A8K0XQ47_9AGAR|nr:kinase-like domain-containing protein [Cristinia sonorae]
MKPMQHTVQQKNVQHPEFTPAGIFGNIHKYVWNCDHALPSESPAAANGNPGGSIIAVMNNIGIVVRYTDLQNNPIGTGDVQNRIRVIVDKSSQSFGRTNTGTGDIVVYLDDNRCLLAYQLSDPSTPFFCLFKRARPPSPVGTSTWDILSPSTCASSRAHMGHGSPLFPPVKPALRPVIPLIPASPKKRQRFDRPKHIWAKARTAVRNWNFKKPIPRAAAPSPISQIRTPAVDPVLQVASVQDLGVITAPGVGQSYQITPVHYVASGAFGRVVVARHPQFGYTALKIVKKNQAKDALSWRFLKAEYRALRRVSENLVTANTRHLVSMWHSWADKSCIYYSMPMYSCTLKSHLEYQSRLHPDDMKLYCRQLASALLALHKLCIIHNDIKSENIFITPFGDLALGDFGISALRPTNPNLSEESGPWALGTPGYLAPEKLFCDRFNVYDPSVDMWSMGVVFLELMLSYEEASLCISELARITELESGGDLSASLPQRKAEYSKCTNITLAQLQRPEYDVVKRMLDFNPATRIGVWELMSGTRYLGDVEKKLIGVRAMHLPKMAPWDREQPVETNPQPERASNLNYDAPQEAEINGFDFNYNGFIPLQPS